VEITEDGNGTQQGLSYYLPGDNFTAMITVPAGGPAIELGSKPAIVGAGYGAVLGYPAQTDCFGNSRAATTLIKVISKASATNIIVKEWS
jgi:hypothetical protein